MKMHTIKITHKIKIIKIKQTRKTGCYTMVTNDDQKVRLATQMLSEEAKYWWTSTKRRIEATQMLKEVLSGGFEKQEGS